MHDVIKHCRSKERRSAHSCKYLLPEYTSSKNLRQDALFCYQVSSYNSRNSNDAAPTVILTRLIKQNRRTLGQQRCCSRIAEVYSLSQEASLRRLKQLKLGRIPKQVGCESSSDWHNRTRPSRKEQQERRQQRLKIVQAYRYGVARGLICQSV